MAMSAKPPTSNRWSEKTTEAFGPIDILVNNAGSLVERQRLAQITEERWDEIMNLNLKSAMLFSQMRRAVDDRTQPAPSSTWSRSPAAMAAGLAQRLTPQPKARSSP